MITVQVAGEATQHVIVTAPGMMRLDDTSQPYRLLLRGGDGAATLIDEADLDLVCEIPWRLLVTPAGRSYAYSRHRYLHRVLLGARFDEEVDHINGDGLDNRRANLRFATRSQNRGNCGKPQRRDGTPPSSQYKGVTWDKTRGLWRAAISHKGRTVNLGRYRSEAEAAAAYDVAAIQQYGDFARINFPGGA